MCLGRIVILYLFLYITFEYKVILTINEDGLIPPMVREMKEDNHAFSIDERHVEQSESGKLRSWSI